MADDALFLGWGAVVRGREQLAFELFGETMQYYGRLQQEGQIEGFDACLLSPHGGDLAGFILLRGERAQLDEVRRSEEFERLIPRINGVVDSLGIVPAYTGGALARIMGYFQETASSYS